jgi:hypothetical protein
VSGIAILSLSEESSRQCDNVGSISDKTLRLRSTWRSSVHFMIGDVDGIRHQVSSGSQPQASADGKP